MTEGDLVNAVLFLPGVQRLSRIEWDEAMHSAVSVALPEADKRAAIIAAIPRALSEGSRGAFIPAFTKKYTTTSVNGTAEYELWGEFEDARAIVNITYDGVLLENPYRVDIRRKYSGIDYPTEVVAWLDLRPVNGFPNVQLIGTPTSAETIEYDYTIKNVSIGEWPVDFEDVLIFGVAKYLVEEYEARFERAKAQMLAFYNPPRGQEHTASLGATLRMLNSDRNDLYGFQN